MIKEHERVVLKSAVPAAGLETTPSGVVAPVWQAVRSNVVLGATTMSFTLIEYQSNDMVRAGTQCGVKTIPADQVIAFSGCRAVLPAASERATAMVWLFL